MSSISARYASLKRDHIPGFPNHMPHVYWKTYLPKFRDQVGDDVALHLLKFHMHVHKLKVVFHEDCLMKFSWIPWRKKRDIGTKVCHLGACIPLNIFI